MGGFSPPKGRSVQVAAGKFVSLPNGKSYQNNETVELTNEEWLAIDPGVVDAGIIIDNGEVGSDSGSGSGAGFDFVTTDADEQPDGTEGQTWLEIRNPTFFAPAWQASTAYEKNNIVQPISANGHWYNAQGTGTSGADVPAWPTDGSTVTDNDITWQDDGLISGQLPQPAVRIYVRQGGDWVPAINGVFAPADENHQAGGFFNLFEQSSWGAIDINTITRANITLDADGNGINLVVNNGTDTQSFAISLSDTDGIQMGGSDYAFKAFGDQALAFFGGEGVEAADRPADSDITDLDMLVSYLAALGLLKVSG